MVIKPGINKEENGGNSPAEGSGSRADSPKETIVKLTTKQIRKLCREGHLDGAACKGKLLELSCGANAACSRHVRGLVPCYLSVQNPDGTYAGTGAGPGFVLGLPIELLEDLGFSDWEIYHDGLNCNVGDRLDSTGAVCSDCASQGGEKTRANRRRREVCWSCAAMARESLEAAERI